MRHVFVAIIAVIIVVVVGVATAVAAVAIICGYCLCGDFLRVCVWLWLGANVIAPCDLLGVSELINIHTHTHMCTCVWLLGYYFVYTSCLLTITYFDFPST